MTAALHPADRATLRARRAPVRRRAWRQAALIAAPIVAIISVLAGIAVETIRPATAAPTLPRRAAAAAGIAATPMSPPREDAAPAAGVTGTIALPPEPTIAPTATYRDPATGAARPFAFGRVGAVDRGRALQCLTAAVYYEAASEPDAGQRAVAQVVLNRVRHPAFPATVCGVVYQGSERAGCQFSFACDGAMARVPASSSWARALRNAAEMLAGAVYAPVGLATHYHTYAVTPAWNRSLVMTDAVGAHFFHRWKGYWGTAPAFNQIYAGGEPAPGPHPRAPTPLSAPVLAATSPMPVIPAQAPSAQPQPAYAASGTPIAELTPPVADALPQSPVLDRWKDVGKPLN